MSDVSWHEWRHAVAIFGACAFAAWGLDRLGYRPISWTCMLELPWTHTLHAHAPHARVAREDDAFTLALLDTALSKRRREMGDTRFDRPRDVDALAASAMAAHLRQLSPTGDILELIGLDHRGFISIGATFAASPLDPPFAPRVRATLARVSLADGASAHEVLPPIIALATRLAAARGALSLEIADLSAPGSALFDAAIACGAAAWSRIVAIVPP